MTRRRRLFRLLWNAAVDRPQNRWMVNLAVGIAVTPAAMLFPLTILFFVDPLWMFDSRQAFALFVGFYVVPWAIAGLLCYLAASHGPPKEKLSRDG
jgi:hypothetical protein